MTAPISTQEQQLAAAIARGVTCTPVIDTAEAEEFTCAVCLGILNTPMLHTACGNMFCAACIEPLKSCPLCRGSLEGPNTLVRAPKAVQNRLDALQVRCDSCGALFTRSEFVRHQETCAVACPFGCGTKLPVSQLPEHCNGGHCLGYEVKCPAAAKPLCCRWRGYGGNAFAVHVEECPLVKLMPMAKWAKHHVKSLQDRVARLEETVRVLEEQRGPSNSNNNSNTKKTDGTENGHTKPFSVGGRGCPGCCCPVCMRTSSACPDGGRYMCCGLCKDCGPCTAK